MIRRWAAFLLSAILVFPLTYAAPSGQTSLHSNLDPPMVAPKWKDRESWRQVHSWSSEFPTNLTRIRIISSLSRASGLVVVKAADPGVNLMEVSVTVFAEKESDLKSDLLNFSVGNDLDSFIGMVNQVDDADERANYLEDFKPTTEVTLEGPDDASLEALWIEMVLRLPRGRHYDEIGTCTETRNLALPVGFKNLERRPPTSWKTKIENLEQFGITLNSLCMYAFSGWIEIDKVIVTGYMGIHNEIGGIKIASSTLTRANGLNILMPNGAIQIEP